jgi:hypothetical protein
MKKEAIPKSKGLGKKIPPTEKEATSKRMGLRKNASDKKRGNPKIRG